MEECTNFVLLCFTLFSENESMYDESEMDYILYGREKSQSTGYEHFQGYLCFKQRKRPAGVQKMIPGAYFECAKGSFDQNFSYCIKDGDFKEFGSRPGSTRPFNKFSKSIVSTERDEFNSIKR